MPRDSPPPCDPPELPRELDCRAAFRCGADGWLTRGAAARDCERAAVWVRAAVFVRGAGRDERALFCTRCTVLVRGVVRDARALFCERVTLLERAELFERARFIAELFVVERAAVLRRSRLFERNPFVVLLSVFRVVRRLFSVREVTFLAPLNSPGLDVAVVAGRPWFTDAS